MCMSIAHIVRADMPKNPFTQMLYTHEQCSSRVHPPSMALAPARGSRQNAQTARTKNSRLQGTLLASRLTTAHDECVMTCFALCFLCPNDQCTGAFLAPQAASLDCTRVHKDRLSTLRHRVCPVMHMTPWDDAGHGPIHHLGMELDAAEKSSCPCMKIRRHRPCCTRKPATMHCTKCVKTLTTTALQGLMHQLMQFLSCLRFVQQANFSGWHVLLQRLKLYRHDVL